MIPSSSTVSITLKYPSSRRLKSLDLHLSHSHTTPRYAFETAGKLPQTKLEGPQRSLTFLKHIRRQSNDSSQLLENVFAQVTTFFSSVLLLHAFHRHSANSDSPGDRGASLSHCLSMRSISTSSLKRQHSFDLLFCKRTGWASIELWGVFRYIFQHQPGHSAIRHVDDHLHTAVSHPPMLIENADCF